MKLWPRPLAVQSRSLLPIAAVFLAVAIFAADTVTNLEIAVPVFYTAIILISVRFCSRRGVVFVGLGCITLTLLSDLLTPLTSANPAGLINTVISIVAIVSTTYLSLKIEAAERSVYEARAHLAHVARVTTLGELTASLAHEVNQPITATAANASASLRWLSMEPPNLKEARAAIERIAQDANRAASIVGRIRRLTKRAPAIKTVCDVNEVIREIMALTESELHRRCTIVRTELENGLPNVNGDRVQLQQVFLNLVMNAIEAMDAVAQTKRTLLIKSARSRAGDITVAVCDSGPGFAREIEHDRLFAPFYSTKRDGMGLGLTITRSIVESHGGRIWAETNLPTGAVFQLTLPPMQDDS